MRIYKTRLKIHKQKAKTINNKTIAKNNLIKSKRVHQNKMTNKRNKRKTLTITCQSFKKKPKSMIDWYFWNFLSKWIFIFYQIFFDIFVFNLFLLSFIIVTIKLKNSEHLRWKLNPLLFIQIFTKWTKLPTKLSWKFVVRTNMHKNLLMITEIFKMNWQELDLLCQWDTADHFHVLSHIMIILNKAHIWFKAWTLIIIIQGNACAENAFVEGIYVSLIL